MATFGEIQTAISKRLLDASNTAVSSSDVAASINDSIRYWKKRRFWFNEVRDTATLTAQDPSFPYPSDFLVPAIKDAGFYIQYSSVRYPLSKISIPQYDNMFLSNGYGLPRWYARIGTDEYQCYPIPDQAYTVGMHYLKDYEDLEGPNDENDFTEFADRLLILWSLCNLTGELRQDTLMADGYQAKAMDEYRQLQVMTNKANSKGKLTIHSIL